MRKDEFEREDPFELIGVEIPSDEDTLDDMARCFVEEFVRLDYPDSLILNMFRSPFHAATHNVYRARGEEFVRGLITQARDQWGRCVFAPTHPLRSLSNSSPSSIVRTEYDDDEFAHDLGEVRHA